MKKDIEKDILDYYEFKVSKNCENSDIIETVMAVKPRIAQTANKKNIKKKKTKHLKCSHDSVDCEYSTEMSNILEDVIDNFKVYSETKEEILSVGL